MHQRTTNSIQTGPPRQLPMQPGRVRNPNVQSALHLDSSRRQQQAWTLPVVPPP